LFLVVHFRNMCRRYKLFLDFPLCLIELVNVIGANQKRDTS
jgi:hypothetical protein